MARTPPAGWQEGFSSRVRAVLLYALATSFSVFPALPVLESPSSVFAVLRVATSADVFLAFLVGFVGFVGRTHVQWLPTIGDCPMSEFVQTRLTDRDAIWCRSSGPVTRAMCWKSRMEGKFLD